MCAISSSSVHITAAIMFTFDRCVGNEAEKRAIYMNLPAKYPHYIEHFKLFYLTRRTAARIDVFSLILAMWSIYLEWRSEQIELHTSAAPNRTEIENS